MANLEREGLLQREAHPTHGRIRRSELTQRGKEIVERAHVLLSNVETVMTAGFEEREIKTLELLLHRSAENLRPSR